MDGKPEGEPETAAERAKSLIGTVISDRYRIHNLLAMGGMGAVYTGEHVHMRKRVAIKILHPDMEGLPGLVARFEREAIVGAHVEHPNIAGARDFGRLPDGSCYLVLEFVRGLTLRQLIQQGPLSVTRALNLAKQIAAGLSAIHARGIVHRDVAPRNVMVIPGADERVKLIDFGFAKVPVERFAAMSVQQGTPILPSEITSPGVVFGTIGYLAPEGALGMRAVDARSDLYALGAMLFEMLAGVQPFEAPTQALLFLKHRSEPLPSIKARLGSANVPEKLEAVVRKLLEKMPDDRFQTADEVLAALDEASAGLGPESSRPPEEDLQLTVLGAEPPPSLPRFEDVAEAERAADPAPRELDTVHAERSPSAVAQSDRKWLALAIPVVLGGVVFAAFKLAPSKPPPPTVLDPWATAEATASATTATGTDATHTADTPASASATVDAPSATATQVAGLDAAAWKQAVRLAPAANNFDRAAEGLTALAELDRAALDSKEMKTAAFETAVRLGSDKDKGEKLIELLAARFGPDGVDVLYEIVTRRGGSRSATLASALLKKPDVRARGSKGLRVALEFRDASCADKPGVLERVRSDGDDRSLALVVASRTLDCSTVGGCCLRDNPLAESVARDLVKRTGSP